MLGLAIANSNGWAEDIMVTTADDSGMGSLRQALTNAEDGDRIVFDITGASTVTLASDLPTVNASLSFSNSNPATPVVIDRAGFAALEFNGSLVDPTLLNLETGGAPSATTDIMASSATTIFGDGEVVGNLLVPGTISPGESPDAGTIGTFTVTGDLDLTNADVVLDVDSSNTTQTSDLIDVDGTLTVTDATLVPRFAGSDYDIGDQFLVLQSTSPLVGTFLNEASAFDLPNNPFLEAISDPGLAAGEFGFILQDNGNSFTDVITGCNKTSAATILDQFRADRVTPTLAMELRTASTEEVQLAVEEISGSLYPSLLRAEINHIQMNLESIRDRVALQVYSPAGERKLTPWVRGYGLTGEVEQDDCQTRGYRHRLGGLELGGGLTRSSGISASVFGHLASGEVSTLGLDQTAHVDSYRLGGTLEFIGERFYVLSALGAGKQNYEAGRSLSGLSSSATTRLEAQSSFDGSSEFGYFELGTAFSRHGIQWSPYVAFFASQVDIDPIQETGTVAGDSDFLLSNGGGDNESLRGILGLALQKSGATRVGIATTRIRFGWMHELSDEATTFVSQVAGTAAVTLVDQGVKEGVDWGFLRTQVEMGTLLGGTVSTAYQGQFNARAAYHSLVSGLAWVY